VFVVKNPADEAWLVACFEEGVDLDLIKEIAELKPLKAVFRDSSFKSDKDKVNTEEYLKNKSPNTQLGVI
jgi:adenine-specific DNA-methyltransferase